MLALMVAGVSLRLLHIGGDSIAADSAWYASMAESLHRFGDLRIPWQSTPESVLYTQHFPPLFPAFLALFFLPAGPSFLAIQIAGFAAAAFFVAVSFFCTRDLYGRGPAFAVGAVAATLPTLLFFDHEALSETFVAALFALTIWAILKSLQKPPFIVLAGIFAGLGYLAKASMGPFFLLAGGAGFLWRFLYVRWRIFQDRWYLLAAGIFALFVLPWAARNVLRHGWPNWQTQKAASIALDALWQREGWPLLVLGALGWVGLILALQALPFLVGAARTVRDWRSDRTSGLLLAVVTPLLVAGFFIAAFSVVEKFEVVYSPHPARYAITPIVPLLWLCVRELDFGRGAPPGEPSTGGEHVRRAAGLAAIGALVMAAFLAFREPYFGSNSARDILILMGGTLVGLSIIGASRAYAWEPVERVTSAGMTWRAVKRRASLAGIGLAVILFVASWLLKPEMIPLILAASAAGMCVTWRQRALVVAIVFLGWGLGGAINAQAYDLAGEALETLAPPGATVSTTIGVEPMVWPFLPEGVTMVYWETESTYIILPWGDRPAPDGYELVDRYGKHAALGPASWLRWRFELAMRGEEPGPAAATVSLYQKISE